MKVEGMDKVREALPELPASQAFSLTRSIYTADDMHAYARAALASQAEKHAAELAKLRQWRDVADDMLTVSHEVASDDPRESIDRLISWHVQVALDPAVSSDAAALVEVGRQQGAKLQQGEARTVRDAAISGPAPSVIAFVPVTQRSAKAWIAATHRHLKRPPRGDLWRVGVAQRGKLIAVGLAGRPCRMLQDGTTAEFTRLASTAEVEVNACSRIYGALRRAGIALGYRRFVTYTLEHEPGTSLRAAGFEDDGLTDGGEWDRPSRPRAPAEQPGRKRRWIWPGRESGLWGVDAPGRIQIGTAK